MGWFRRTFGRKSPPELEVAAKTELEEAAERVWPIYRANLATFLGRMDLLRTMESKFGYQQINDMFLWGVIAAFLSGRTRLPTDAHDRIALHMIYYFAKGDEMPLEEARSRAIAPRKLFATMNPFFDAVIDAGAAAYEDGGDEYLTNAHHAAQG